ncbi:hypothetical protein CF8_0013 [Aeromonas phage CF8]|nr:hypothetical protein CF8_0013 [Aeromonas phage CF8]
MNMVDFCISYVVEGTSDISDYLLKLAFDNPNNGTGFVWGDQNTEYSIEQGIREKVIAKMINPLFNAASGNTEIIDLSGAHIKSLSGGTIHVNVPDFLTGGRKILSVLEVYPGNINRAVAAGYNFSSYETCNGGGEMGNAMNRLMQGLDNGQVQRVYTHFTMVGNNTFLIRDAGSAMFNMVAKVVLSYDEHFSTIPPKSYFQMAKLVELGVKAYIYKTCRRGMQEAVARFGVSIDEIREEVNEYRDAGVQFREFFEEEIQRYLAYADPKGVSDSLRMLVPRRK